MPLHINIRSSPGGVEEHQGFITSQAHYLLSSQLFSDLSILTPEGPVPCHSTIMIPLSPFLSSAISSYPSFPGFVHTLVVPIMRDTVEKILQIIYKGNAPVANRDGLDQIYSGLRLLGIYIHELECHRETGYISSLKEEQDVEEDEDTILEEFSQVLTTPLWVFLQLSPVPWPIRCSHHSSLEILSPHPSHNLNIFPPVLTTTSTP